MEARYQLRHSPKTLDRITHSSKVRKSDFCNQHFFAVRHHFALDALPDVDEPEPCVDVPDDAPEDVVPESLVEPDTSFLLLVEPDVLELVEPEFEPLEAEPDCVPDVDPDVLPVEPEVVPEFVEPEFVDPVEPDVFESYEFEPVEPEEFEEEPDSDGVPESAELSCWLFWLLTAESPFEREPLSDGVFWL